MGAVDEGCASGIQERAGTFGLTVSVQVRVAGGHAQTRIRIGLPPNPRLQLGSADRLIHCLQLRPP